MKFWALCMLATLGPLTGAGVLLWWLAHARHATRVWIGNDKQQETAWRRRGIRKGWAIVQHGVSAVYPVTKRKLHRLLNLLGVLVAGAAGAAIWVANLPLTLPQKVIGTCTLVSTLLTSANLGIRGADKFVDRLPIPETETTTVSITTTKPSDGVPEEADQLAVTGVHGKGDLP